MAGAGNRPGVTFYFDPGCPWTWLTSRWLVSAAAERSLDIRWRTFSLALLNEDKPVPAFLDTPELKAKLGLAKRGLRVVDAALADDDNEAAGRFYTELGTRLHVAGHEPGEPMLVEAAAAAGVSHLLASLDDPALDVAAAGSLAEALRLAGPDIGSPVLHLDGAERGTFGPIVSPSPPARRPAACGTPWPLSRPSARSSSSSRAGAIPPGSSPTDPAAAHERLVESVRRACTFDGGATLRREAAPGAA